MINCGRRKRYFVGLWWQGPNAFSLGICGEHFQCRVRLPVWLSQPYFTSWRKLIKLVKCSLVWVDGLTGKDLSSWGAYQKWIVLPTLPIPFIPKREKIPLGAPRPLREHCRVSRDEKRFVNEHFQHENTLVFKANEYKIPTGDMSWQLGLFIRLAQRFWVDCWRGKVGLRELGPVKICKEFSGSPSQSKFKPSRGWD